ncbi:hypothetical protein [Cohnella nanjingensis]|uniref:Tetratricopeptide repeat protein n=1 Tax=Cohnella nanjingensis TaxID=1387779 RepID=A0A7X0RUD3_9BACL|nr:hypothetical protein [Cohnella nanjingensis]MBB6672585.1 hypothetical protein [Cohnella nanjingensis]
MKKMILVLLTAAFLVLISGCGKSDFDKYMDQGKEQLRLEEFDEALKSFDNALIEEPTNKDAKALYDRAKKSFDDFNEKKNIEETNKQMHLEIDQYYKNRVDIYNKIKEHLDPLDAKNFSIGVFKRMELQQVFEGLSNRMDAINIDATTTSPVESIKAELDGKLTNSISNVLAALSRSESQPESKYNGVYLKFANDSLVEWNNEVQKYKNMAP